MSALTATTFVDPEGCENTLANPRRLGAMYGVRDAGRDRIDRAYFQSCERKGAGNCDLEFMTTYLATGL
jgi:hypothetical protein